MTTLRFKTHNDSEIDVNGTSQQGAISETFENLLKVSELLWMCQIVVRLMLNGILCLMTELLQPFTIGKTFTSMGSNGTNSVDNKTWHIGGKTISAVYDIEEILQNIVDFL